MKDCWKILGLPPTDDAAAIKRVYRDLVKKYHPDKVVTPEQKRKHTILCAEINQAYRHALEQARSLVEPQPAAEPDAAPPADFQAQGAHARGAPPLFSAFNRRLAVTGLLLVFLLAQFMYLVPVSVMRSLTSGLHIAQGIVATVVVVCFILMVVVVYGVILAGALDLVIVFLFPRRVITRAGLGKYQDKIVWLVIVAANLGLFFFTDAVRLPTSSARVYSVYDGLFRALAAGTLPLFLAVGWLRELIRYRRVRNNVGEFAAGLGPDSA